MILRLSDPTLCAASGRASEERMLIASLSISDAPRDNGRKRRLAGRLMSGVIVGHDPKAFGRLGSEYEDHRD